MDYMRSGIISFFFKKVTEKFGGPDVFYILLHIRDGGTQEDGSVCGCVDQFFPYVKKLLYLCIG